MARPRSEARRQAIQGAMVKYQGSPCKKCSGVVRYTKSGNCINENCKTNPSSS